MGFLRRLTGKASVPVVSIGDGDTVSAFAMTWEVSRSPAGQFALLWRDGNDAGTAYGARDSGPGRWVLLDNGRPRALGQLDRPNGGRVADNGSFAIADLLLGSGRHGEFRVFDAEGRALVHHRYRATIGGVFIDPLGRLAGVTTVRSTEDPPEDDEVFDLWQLPGGRRVWRSHVVGGGFRSVVFDMDAHVIHVDTERYGPFDYDLADGSIDVDRLRDLELEHGTGFVALLRAEHELARPGQLDRARADAVVALCDLAVARFGADNPVASARAERLAGEVLVQIGDERGAIDHWARALAHDPKVGVKRKLDALKARARHESGSST